MSADEPGFSDMNDDLAAAYAKAQALTDEGRGPSAAVRARVLAAAAEVAAAARERVDVDTAPTLRPVAPPMAAVGRTRGRAVNLSSWRVRAGAALCAALLVAVMSWRFDASGRLHGDVQVALAELRLAAPPSAAPPQELPVPALSAASASQAPLPMVADPLARSRGVASANGKPSVREPDLVVAQADSRERAPPPQFDVLVRAQRTPAPAEAKKAAAAPPVSTEQAGDAAAADVPRLAATAPPVPAPAPMSNAAPAPPIAVTAAAAPQFMTASPMPPSVVPRRYALAPHAPSVPVTPERETAAAAAQQSNAQRIETTGSPPFSSARLAEALRKMSPPPGGRLVDASARLLPGPLQSAAEHGDVETLRRLLADPATRVDALDSSGRTALLHAVLAQRVDAVRLLLVAGADPDRADASGLTPRAAAQAGSDATIAAALAASPQ